MNKEDKFELKIDPENNMFIGPDGCHYDTKSEAIRSKLGICGCGCPEDIHEFFIECLKTKSQFGGIDYQKIEELVKENIGLVAEIILHFLDDKGLTEHGSSVYGSWLTDAGKQFIDIGCEKTDDEEY